MRNTEKILVGVASGLVVGGIIGILMAPEKGVETRRKILGRKKKLMEKIKDKIKEEQEKMMQAEEKIRRLMKERLSCSTGEKMSEPEVDAQ